MKKVVVISLLLFLFNLTSAQTQYWQQMPGPYGGTVYSIAVNSNNHLFAGVTGADGGGIYRSTNSGDSWISTNNYPSFWIVARALAINSSGGIFAGTDYGAGVFRSTDNGETWTQINNGLTRPFVYTIAINSTGHIFVGTNFGGVFRSTDNGNNWSQINNGLDPNQSTYALAINSSGTVFAGTYNRGMFRSTNSGQSWEQINAGITDSNMSSLAINASSHIFAGTFNGRMYRSSNDGVSWIQTSSGLPPSSINSLVSVSSGYVFAATDSSVYRSTNNGDTWSRINSGLPYFGTYTLAVDSSGRIFVGTSQGGIFRSTNNGESWSQSSTGLLPIAVRVVRTNTRDHIFAAISGSSGRGIFRSTDGGGSWKPLGAGLVNLSILALAINTRENLFAVVDGDQLFRSVNNGDNWTPISSSFSSRAVAVHVSITGDVYVAAWGTLSGSLFRSTDDGETWNHILGGDFSVGPTAFNQSGHIFVATSQIELPYTTRIHRSTNNGISWTNNIFGNSVNDIVINSRGHIFAATYSGVGGISHSTDNGESWAAISNSPYASELAVNSRDCIFAASTPNVFLSTDTGLTWTQINTGLPNQQGVRSFAFDTTGHIFAGTTVGLFRSTESTTAVLDQQVFSPTSAELFQNFPNPFNPRTIIRFSLPFRKKVRLQVFDMLGRQITSVIDEFLEAGIHSVNWDASTFSSGVYFYRIDVGDLIKTGRMVLLR